MKILVTVKRVVDAYVKIKIKADGSGVDKNQVKMSMNPFDEMLNQAQAASRQLAKRQLTWCRSWKKIDFILDKIPLDQVIIDKTIDEIVSLAFPNNYGV